MRKLPRYNDRLLTPVLNSAGIKEVSTDGAYVTFQTTVGTANSLLNTVFMNFENSGVSKIRTTQYSIPEELVDYIDLIDPTIFLGKATAAVPISTRKAKASAPPKRSVDASCSTSITPACLKELYNTVGYTPDPQSGSTIGYGSFLNQSSIYSDLLLFEQTFPTKT
jgi:tripeptidyl-peptidase I